ncbi:MAG: hypothetical protein NZ959_02195 [Armatimonadetes bacterium]|nr:hypothetical protein [Armatimonadota bacterium]MDW8121015.1 hypothetical protein [Armatimonadota bacterium]
MKDGQQALGIVLVIGALLSWTWAALSFWRAGDLGRQWEHLNRQDLSLSRQITEARERVTVGKKLLDQIGKPLDAIQPGQFSARLVARLEGILQKQKIRLESVQPLSWQVMDEEGYLRLPVQFSASTTGDSLKDGLKAVTGILKDLKTEKPPAFLERWSLQVSEGKNFRIQAQVAWFYPLSEKLVKELRRTQQRSSPGRRI